MSPSAAYHGLTGMFGSGSDIRNARRAGGQNVAFVLRARAEGLRDWGPASVRSTASAATGPETLSLRAERHFTHGLATWLQGHPVSM